MTYLEFCKSHVYITNELPFRVIVSNGSYLCEQFKSREEAIIWCDLRCLKILSLKDFLNERMKLYKYI